MVVAVTACKALVGAAEKKRSRQQLVDKEEEFRNE